MTDRTEILALVERLGVREACAPIIGSDGASYMSLRNPDGPDAAAALKQMLEEREESEKALRIVQNSAKTLASCRNTELEHLRQNATFDHRLRAEHESLLERDAQMTEALLAAETELAQLKAATRTAAMRELAEGAGTELLEDRLREALMPFAEAKTVDELLMGRENPSLAWMGASPERRIEMLGERKRENTANILRARAALAPAGDQKQPWDDERLL